MIPFTLLMEEILSSETITAPHPRRRHSSLILVSSDIFPASTAYIAIKCGVTEKNEKNCSHDIFKNIISEISGGIE
jgi:hypothetical protein